MKSTSELHAELLAFLSGAFALVEHNTIERVELRHAPSSSRPEMISDWTPSNRPELFATQGQMAHVAPFTTEVLQIAMRYAESFARSTPERFEVIATGMLGRTHKHPFLVYPAHDPSRPETSSSGGLSTALAMAGGAGVAAGQVAPAIVTMLIQHIESHHKNTQEMIAQFGTMLGQHSAALREENQELRAGYQSMIRQRAEDLQLLEQARSEEHKRQIEALTATSSEERKTIATKKVVALLPAALSILSRRVSAKRLKEGEPQKRSPPTPLSLLIGKLFVSLTDGQIASLQTTLAIEQQIVLGEIRDLIESGGELSLLPTMLYDMADSLTQEQQQAIFGALDPEQRQMFLQAVMMAKASQKTTEDTVAAATGAAESVKAPEQP
jgi:peptidyl-tRNA hydrolase